MSQRVEVPRALLAELLAMQDESPQVRAALDARFAGVFTDELELTMRGGGSNASVDYVVEHFARPECNRIDRCFAAWGLVVARFVQRAAPSDPGRKAHYAKKLNIAEDAPQLQTVDDWVPVVPALETFALYRFIDAEGREAYEAVAAAEGVALFVVRSLRMEGPRPDGQGGFTVSSDMGCLLRAWRLLQRVGAMAQAALENAACPPIFVEQVAPTAFNEENIGNQRRTAQEAFAAAGGEGAPAAQTYLEPDARDVVRPAATRAALLQRVAAGRHADPLDQMVTLPRLHRLGAAHAVPQLEGPLAEREAAFATHVASIVRVPVSYLGGAQRRSALHDAQSTLASDNDKERYMMGVQGAQRDLVHFFKTAYAILGERDVYVKLPVTSHATLEQLQLLRETHAISQDVYSVHAVRHAHMPPALALRAPPV